MVEAAMLWNEPNNLSHWDFELDPTWERFADMARLAADAVRAERPSLTRVLGGMSWPRHTAAWTRQRSPSSRSASNPCCRLERPVSRGPARGG